MKIIVSGGAGFIGSHVVDILIKNDHEVVVIDDLSSGKKSNINKSAKFYKADITKKLDPIFRREMPNAVIHLAAQINVRTSVKEPVKDATINILGSINLLECCKKFDVKKFVFSSSGGAIYGDPDRLPCDEEHPQRPLCPYGAAKRAVEAYIYIYSTQYSLDYNILRYSNVYGPRQSPEGGAGVVAIFTGRLLRNQDLAIFGDGKQTRDYVFVDDVARANLLAVTKTTKSKVFNIGAGKETSVNEIYDLIAGAVGSSGKPTHTPTVAGEVSRIYLDIKRAKKELGWSPTVDLKSGITRTVEHIKSEIK